MKMRSFVNNETYNRHCSCSENIIFKRGNKVYKRMSCKMSVILTKNNSSLAWNICFLAELRGENWDRQLQKNKSSLISRLRSPVLYDGVVYPVLVRADPGVDSRHVRPAAAHAETDDAHLEPAAPVLAD